VANVSRSSRAEGLTLFGYCQGGTMAVMYATMDLVSSDDKEMLVMDAGHVSLMASPVAKEELWPRIAATGWGRSRGNQGLQQGVRTRVPPEPSYRPGRGTKAARR
jgi:hypothetical protein